VSHPVNSEPIDGWFGDYAVQLRNVSAGGALVQCDEEIPGRALLRFFRHGSELELLAEFSGSSLTFLDDTLELLLAQEANALGNREQNVYGGDQTLTAASSRVSATFVTWIFIENGWSSHLSHVADQPPDGFTVYATEPEDQVALLRSSWESGDAESQRLTRIFAEMSIKQSGR
jgi:hypothetical protein